MSKEYFSPLLIASFPHDVWMALWEAYEETNFSPFLEEIMSLVTPVMVPPTLDEISPLDSLVDSTDLVPTTDASDSMQQEIPCLRTSASWDEFLLDIVRLFIESHIEDVGDIIDHICLLFFEENTSRIVETDSDTSNNTSIDLDTWGSTDRCSKKS